MPARSLTLLPEAPRGLSRGAGSPLFPVHRPFFLAGLATVLTAGCLLGAAALLGISLRGDYTASGWTPYVLAHANSQLYGWVGFFVMGFALQMHAPMPDRLALFRRLAWASLGLMAAGIALRFAAEPLAAADRRWVALGVFSAALQAAAVLLFLANIWLTRLRTGTKMWQAKIVFVSLGWWVAVAIAEPFVFLATHGPEQAANLAFVARWFVPYREAQFLGFTALMIFGVGLMKFHECFGAAEPNRRLAEAGFWVWNAGLIARIAGWLAYHGEEMRPGGDLLYNLGGAALFAGALLLVAGLRVFETAKFALRSHKFIRAGLVWLAIAGFLMVLEPIHLSLTGSAFSHAYGGAIRHAVTVGFISQMIVGVSSHVVVMANGLDPQRQNQLWAVFWLLNAGNALRVFLEIATDYTASAFLPMGATGFIELLALWIFAADVARPILPSRRLAHAA